MKIKGPSFCLEGGWICCSNGLAKAKQMIEDGTITAALVGVTNLTIWPGLQNQYQGLNKLNNDNLTKSINVDGKHCINININIYEIYVLCINNYLNCMYIKFKKSWLQLHFM